MFLLHSTSDATCNPVPRVHLQRVAGQMMGVQVHIGKETKPK